MNEFFAGIIFYLFEILDFFLIYGLFLFYSEINYFGLILNN